MADANYDERKKILLERLFELNREINKLEKQITGRVTSALRTGFAYDRRFSWRKDDEGLTPLERRFVQEYPKDLNGTKSVVRAGYSEKGASVRAAVLLGKRKVVRALRKEYNRITKRNRVEQDQVVSELARIAYSNIGDFVRWGEDGVTLVSSRLLSRTDTAVVKEVSETVTPKTTNVKIKLYDKPQALITLCRYLGILDRKDADPKDKETAAREIKEAVDRLYGSVPVNPDELPDNVKRFDKRLKDIEERNDSAERDV
jgi:phage terminase small subunit